MLLLLERATGLAYLRPSSAWLGTYGFGYGRSRGPDGDPNCGRLIVGMRLAGESWPNPYASSFALPLGISNLADLSGLSGSVTAAIAAVLKLALLCPAPLPTSSDILKLIAFKL